MMGLVDDGIVRMELAIDLFTCAKSCLAHVWRQPLRFIKNMNEPFHGGTLKMAHMFMQKILLF